MRLREQEKICGQALQMLPDPAMYRVAVTAKRWLSEQAFEIRLEKPPDFKYRPGQKIICTNGLINREYTLVGTPADEDLALCVKNVPGGKFSSFLAGSVAGDIVGISRPFGFFTCEEGSNIFVATGTGIAPYVSYARSGVRDFTLLHGVSSSAELYYRDLFVGTAKEYIPCLSLCEPSSLHLSCYCGRVTSFIERKLAAGTYTFYLCGNGQMIRDAMGIIDRNFPESRVFTELFFTRTAP